LNLPQRTHGKRRFLAIGFLDTDGGADVGEKFVESRGNNFRFASCLARAGREGRRAEFGPL
jgi:hypothetical protein